jgi:apolipoprotein N-acyltransferase
VTTVLSALLTGILFFLSIDLGTLWPLAWIAAVPALWYAFAPGRGWPAFAMAFCGYALGQTNLLGAYWGQLPVPVILLAITAPALGFALAVGSARMVFRRLGPLVGLATFTAAWAGLDFALSLLAAGGSVMTPAASQIDAPRLAQSASLVGYYGITFLLGAVSGSLALALRRRQVRWAAAAIGLFAANLAFGSWQLAQPITGTVRVALLASDDLAAPFKPARRDEAERIFAGYQQAVARLAGRRPSLIVLPENIAQLAPEWREAALRPLAKTGWQTGVTLVVGVDTRTAAGRSNTALVLAPDAAPVAYAKRHLVPGLETGVFVPGSAGLTVPGGTGVAICKDMDFQDTIRRDVAAGRPVLLAVPAWDFGADGWMHARVAMLRSIESGVPMARSARNGLLTLNDRYGRIVARAQSSGRMTSLVGDLPVDRHPTATLYTRLGDVFGFICLLFGCAMVAAAMRASRAKPERQAFTPPSGSAGTPRARRASWRGRRRSRGRE